MTLYYYSIIPISKDGTHTWDNVKLAHRKCNSLKQDKEIEFVGCKNEVAEKDGFYNQNISRVCRGKAKTHKGYTWELI